MSGLEYVLVIIPVLLVLAVLAWFVHRALDEERIKSFLRQRGNTQLECRPTPLGRNWWAEQLQRAYAVRYQDEAGHEHQATVQIRGLGGLLWSDDKIVRLGGPAAGSPALEEENRRLREEVARLKSQRKGPADDERLSQ